MLYALVAVCAVAAPVRTNWVYSSMEVHQGAKEYIVSTSSLLVRVDDWDVATSPDRVVKRCIRDWAVPYGYSAEVFTEVEVGPSLALCANEDSYSGSGSTTCVVVKAVLTLTTPASEDWQNIILEGIPSCDGAGITTVSPLEYSGSTEY